MIDVHVYDALRRMSQRETEVMRLICEGLTAQGIGEALGISSRTVEQHRRRAIIKLGARNQTHAAVLFDRHRTASAPAGEVVAYKITDADGGYWFTDNPENPDLFDCEITQVPLYAHPPAPTSKGMKDE